ncbi:alkaline phosphatase family protein [Phenylobacterium aquaticum]|uniref:alkaline phosphatase family protein n=1 Tax=Phenylobacterium aquaticum TaxID=1763816 RepID=UPI0026EA134B|nr:alkaline phosphatase family protein [Phenylobacterium aquaticum]
MVLSWFGRMAATIGASVSLHHGAPPAQHNLILFVADALRSEIVDETTAPAMAAVRSEGVDFRNSHSLFPTVTTANASAISTGHRLGDTGDFGNTIYVGAPLPAPVSSPLPGLESDTVLGVMNQRFGGNYLNEISLLHAAHDQGFQTAVLGKHGPAAIQDALARDGTGTIVIDDATGHAGGLPLSPEITAAIRAAGLEPVTPDRAENARDGTKDIPGTLVENRVQQDWLTAVATKVLLPRFKAGAKPFVLVFWSRDPDGTQHNQGDSLNSLTPGVNGPTSLAAIRNASDDLAALRAAVKAAGLEATTNIVITADHGVAVASKASETSAAARLSYPDVTAGHLPSGFLAIDLAQALNLPIHDGKGALVDPAKGGHPGRGALLGPDPAAPQVVLGPNGGAELIYLPGPDAKALAPRVVQFLTQQDYTGAIFVDDALGPLPGALPLSAVGLTGKARTPRPAIVVSFKSFSTGCDRPELCAAEVADTDLRQGQGIHGTVSRQDTHNFMAAIGPDFRTGFVDPAPVSNADLAITTAHILGIKLPSVGAERGRVMGEALAADGKPRKVTTRTLVSAPAQNGFITKLDMQQVGKTPYVDAAGMPGRVVGLKP